jgi:hypothetical protein
MSEPITIVSGLPRSGTSMMMQILAAGGMPVLTDDLRPPDEDNPRGYFEFERVKQVKEDASWLPEAQGKAVKMVYRLLYDLPDGFEYRVIFMTRKLEEVIQSQDEMLQRHGKQDSRLSEEQLRDIYERQLSEAKRWLADHRNYEVLYVDYLDVVENPTRMIDDINTFLGGRLDREAMLTVPDAALYRNRR